MIPKAPELFDRDVEWAELAAFAANDAIGATLALVYGRRRQGKTLLLELLTEATGGFMVTGLEQSSAMNLVMLGDAYAKHIGLGAPVEFGSWQDAVDALLAIGERDHPVPIVLDEFPYLVASTPELPSIIQRALSPRGRARRQSRARLILCGSAFSIMRNLLSGTAPLRGRAPRELVVHPFDYRQSAEFWGLAPRWELALRVHALCGGTPAYLDYCSGDTPRRPTDFDAWVVRNLLNPSSAFFREGRVLVSEEPELKDTALYLSVLSAIAAGHTRRGQIAATLGRRESALAHPLGVLQETRLVQVHQDALRARRTTYRITEPMLRFHQAVIAPRESRLARRVGERVWAELADTVNSKIFGPHFEELAREWARGQASSETVGGTATTVGTTEITCAVHRRHELDVVVVESSPHEPSRVCAIGEAKWRGDPVGIEQVERLRHIRSLLRTQPADVRLLLFSRSGCTPAVMKEAARAGDVEVVDLDRLYTGS